MSQQLHTRDIEMKYQTLKRIRDMSANELADIALQMAEIYPEAFEILLDKVLPESESFFRVPGTTHVVTFSDDQLSIINSHKHANNKVACIKYIRSIYPTLSLKEAKELVERYWFNDSCSD